MLYFVSISRFAFSGMLSVHSFSIKLYFNRVCTYFTEQVGNIVGVIPANYNTVEWMNTERPFKRLSLNVSIKRIKAITVLLVILI